MCRQLAFHRWRRRWPGGVFVVEGPLHPPPPGPGARVGALVGRDVPDGDQRERRCCGQPDRRASNMTLLHVISLLAWKCRPAPRWSARLGTNVPRPPLFGPSGVVEKTQRARVRVNPYPTGFINSDDGDRRGRRQPFHNALLTANRRIPCVNPTAHRPDLARTGRHVPRRAARRYEYFRPTTRRVAHVRVIGRVAGPTTQHRRPNQSSVRRVPAPRPGCLTQLRPHFPCDSATGAFSSVHGVSRMPTYRRYASLLQTRRCAQPSARPRGRDDSIGPATGGRGANGDERAERDHRALRCTFRHRVNGSGAEPEP